MSTMPTVGRIVHYRSFGTPGGEHPQACRAALVTEGDGESSTISLAVHNPTGLFFDRDIEQDESRERGGSWHWPCVRT